MLVSAFGVYVMVANAVGGGSLLGNLLGFAIALFYAIGTGLGGIAGPALFGRLIELAAKHLGLYVPR